MSKIYTSNLDRVFAALSDPTRRKIVEILHEEEATILDLSASFDMSFQAVSKHVNVLQKANLIKKKRKGKFFVCSYQPKTMNEMVDWISKHYHFWREGFEKLEIFIDQKGSKNDE